MTLVNSLHWTGASLAILDQRVLPAETIYQEYQTAPDIADAIRAMQVRGAPAIGIAAAYAVALSVKQHSEQQPDRWLEAVESDMEILRQARPTAVNLFWALDKMRAALALATTPDTAWSIAREVAEAIERDDLAANRRIGELGADLLTDARGVLTHCNAGALATAGHGTALGVIRTAYARAPLSVYAGETRPWLQGARLTVWELSRDTIPVTLIADSAAAWLMRQGSVDWLVVGADRICANGDTANKIGTYSLALLARAHGVKVMIAAPTSTVDLKLSAGDAIEIEMRDAFELLPDCYRTLEQPVSAWNPVFDVTPAYLIDAIVTERGVAHRPHQNGIQECL
ncbi:MAG: S-methyl-5-thioribose-1-phosphate isomerase [Methylococcales bacterium]|nr:S-methyl-5-thioribose-1-phosphate isomerase [Methylococcales bacterium]